MTKLIAPPKAPESSTETFPKLADYLGQIVVLGPTEETEVQTKYKDATKATRCIGWAWVNGKLIDLGDLLVFWGKVRAQLHEALAQNSYVVGRIVKDGRSYVLEPVTTTATIEAITSALDF